VKLLHAELTVENCAAELWLNDIPIAKLGPTGSQNTSIPAHMYVVDGENILETVMGVGPEPSASRQAGDEPLKSNAAVRARLVALEPGQFTGDPNAEILARIDETPNGQPEVPRIGRGVRRLGPVFGLWAWQSLPRLRFDPATTSAVEEVLERIRDSFQRGDPSVLVDLARPKFEAAARAYPTRTLPQIIEQFEGVVRRYASTPGWGMQPLAPDQFSFRVVAGGRLIECINKDWKATVRSAPLASGFPYYFPIFLGMNGNRLAVYL
jgi:hypothetical protein